MASYHDLTEAQQKVILEFRRKHGRAWKDKLVTLWLSSKPRAPELQQIRNTFGPSWLFKVKDWPKKED